MELFKFDESFIGKGLHGACSTVYTPKGTRKANDLEYAECAQDTTLWNGLARAGYQGYKR